MSFTATIYVPDKYSKIQEAIDNSIKWDTIIVRPNTYVENIDFMGKAITVKSEMGPIKTVIDGNQAGSVVTFKKGETGETVLEGFTIRNGLGNLYEHSPGQWFYCGGGIFCESPNPVNPTEPTITRNVIVDNMAEHGGGVYCRESFPMIMENTIAGNEAGWTGGGISCHSSSPTIRDNIIKDNTTWGYGSGIYCCKLFPIITDNLITENNCSSSGACGGICCDDSSPLIVKNIVSGNSSGNMSYCGGIGCINNAIPEIRDNLIAGNKADCWGGGILCNGASPRILNNIIVENETIQKIYGGGGGIYCGYYASPTITNNTLYGNSSTVGGGGLCTYSGANPFIYNTIFWGNGAPTGKEIYIGTTTNPSLIPSSMVIRYSNVEGGTASVHVDLKSSYTWGPGMLKQPADPLFIDPNVDDFHIPANSPCRDSGWNTAPWLPENDFEGDPRKAYNTVDIGADEFHRHLYWTGNATPGGNVEMKLVGLPGTAPVQLWLGSGILEPPWPTTYGEWYLKFPLLASVGLGPIPSPNGVSILPFTLPNSMPTPLSLPFQAGIGMELTNLSVMEVE